MPRINTLDRARIVVLRELNFPYSYISEMVGCSKSSAGRVFAKYKKQNTVKDLPRPGRPSICSDREKRIIYRISMGNRRLTAPKIRNELAQYYHIQMSTTSVQRVLRQLGLYGRIARKKRFYLINKNQQDWHLLASIKNGRHQSGQTYFFQTNRSLIYSTLMADPI